MKTIKTLADEIGVTKQAIFQKMKKEPLASGLNNLTTRVGGIVYVYPEGEGMIKEQFYRTQRVFTLPQTVDSGINESPTKILKEQLDRKDRQLEVLSLHISIKDKQIATLHRQIEELSAALSTSQDQMKNAQNLHYLDMQKGVLEKLITSQSKASKSSFWNK